MPGMNHRLSQRRRAPIRAKRTAGRRLPPSAMVIARAPRLPPGLASSRALAHRLLRRLFGRIVDRQTQFSHLSLGLAGELATEQGAAVGMRDHARRLLGHWLLPALVQRDDPEGESDRKR